MFRFWAGATAGICVCSFVVSGVSAEGIGSTIAPPIRSQVSIASLFANADFFSRSRPADYWGRSAELGVANAIEIENSRPSFAYLDLEYSLFGATSSLNRTLDSALSEKPRLNEALISTESYSQLLESVAQQRWIRPSVSGWK